MKKKIFISSVQATDIVEKCLAAGLPEPQFIQAEDFKSILYRPSTDQVRDQVREQAKEQVPRKYPASTEELPQEFRSTSRRKIILTKIPSNPQGQGTQRTDEKKN